MILTEKTVKDSDFECGYFYIYLLAICYLYLLYKEITKIKAIRDILVLWTFNMIKYLFIPSEYNWKIDKKYNILDKFKKCLYYQSYVEYERRKELMEIWRFGALMGWVAY